MFPIANTILRGFLRIWTLKFYSQNRGSPKAFFECLWDLNGRFFIFKRTQSRFGEKFPNTALFYPEKLSQSFRRFLVRYAELIGSHYSRLVRLFYFPDTINKESEMMPMKKITFNALLNHKAHNYKPMQIEVEKVIPLYGKRFAQTFRTIKSSREQGQTIFKSVIIHLSSVISEAEVMSLPLKVC